MRSYPSPPPLRLPALPVFLLKLSKFLIIALQLSAMPLSRMDTDNVRLPPSEKQCNGIKKMEINGNHKRSYPQETTSSSQSPVDDRIPGDLIYVSYERTAADSVDKTSRVLFPVLFIIYNIVYWAVYALPGSKPK